MIVTCPACESRFEVEREQLGYDGRIVRCGKCGNCWHQMPEDETPAPPAQPEAAEEQAKPVPPRLAARRQAAAAKNKKRGSGGMFGWLALLFFLLAVVAASWFARDEIVARFPQTEVVYAALGIPVTLPGPKLELRVNDPRSVVREGDRVILLEGTVTNITRRKQPVPKLKARLTDSEGTVLLEWIFEAPKAELDAGAEVDFVTETINPPDEGQNLTINFVKDEE